MERCAVRTLPFYLTVFLITLFIITGLINTMPPAIIINIYGIVNSVGKS